MQEPRKTFRRPSYWTDANIDRYNANTGFIHASKIGNEKMPSRPQVEYGEPDKYGIRRPK
jgi:hypothetical protein